MQTYRDWRCVDRHPCRRICDVVDDHGPKRTDNSEVNETREQKKIKDLSFMRVNGDLPVPPMCATTTRIFSMGV